MPDLLILDVVPVYKTRPDALEDPVKTNLSGCDQKMDMIGHQTVSQQLKAADLLIFAKNRQIFSIILVIPKNELLAVSAYDHMVDTESTDKARTC